MTNKFKNNSILFVLAVFCFALSARAEPSSANRQDKTWMLAAQPIGFGPVPAFSSGLILGYFQQPDLILQLEYTSGWRPNYMNERTQKTEAGSGSSTSSSSWHSEFSSQAIGVHAKYFLSNAFYVKGGIDHRRVKHSDHHTTRNVPYEFEGQAFSAALAIGVQWQFSYFTHGMDLLGLVVPFSNSYSESFPSSPTDYGMGLTRDAEQNYLKSQSLMFARYYLGVSF